MITLKMKNQHLKRRIMNLLDHFYIMLPKAISGYNKNHHGEKFKNDPNPPFYDQKYKPGLSTFFKFVGAERDVVEPLPVRNPKEDFNRQPGIRFFWIGHATNLIQFYDTWIITDPVFSDCASPLPGVMKRITPPACSIDELPEISVILVSHDHYDHLDSESIRKINERFPKCINFAPLKVSDLLESWGYKAVSFDWRQHLVYKGVDFTCFPARHATCRYGYDSMQRLWCSWMMECNKVNIYFPGDTAVGPHFKEIREVLEEENMKVDLALMPIGPQLPENEMRVVHLDPKDTWDMQQELKAKIVVPIHYGVFPLGLKPEVDDIPLLKSYWKDDNLKIINIGDYLEWDGDEFVIPDIL